jgi:anti-anti-sigma factor
MSSAPPPFQLLRRAAPGVVPVGPPPFVVRIRADREAAHVGPVGELDSAATATLRGEVDKLVGVGFTHVVIDLRELVFMDCAGLGLLLTLAATARHEGWRLSLIQGSEAVHRLFALTATLDVLPFQSSTTAREAPDSVKRRPAAGP